MSLKAEFNEVSKNTWGIGIIISWGIFIFFAFWNMIESFIKASTDHLGFLAQGLISLVSLGVAALYLLSVLIAKKTDFTTTQLYMLFSTFPISLLFLMAVITAYIPSNFLYLLWTFATMFIGSVGIIISTYYYINTKSKPPKRETTTTV